MISLLMAQGIVRWAYYSYKTKLYCVCNNGIKPQIDEDSIMKLAFIISRPTNAVINMKAWDIVYQPLDTLKQKDCSICYDSLQSNKFITMNCKHSFCFECFQGCIHSIKNTEQCPTCPMCRAIVTQVNVPDIFIYNSLAETLYKL
jgi:hypothetical protein